MEDTYIGVDIGGTKTAVCLGNHKGQILTKEQFPTPSTPDKAVNSIVQAARRLIRSGTRSSGISCGGPLDAQNGIVLSPPNLPGWDRIPVVEMLKDATGLDAAIENDANACALAEWFWGAGAGCQNMIFLTFGTGLGAGLILDGRLYRGALGLAGEVGHIRMADDGPSGYGKKGAWEGFCSGGGLGRHYHELHGEEISGKEVCLRAERGERQALEVIRISAEKLGAGLALLIDILNPECIVIGSVYRRSEKLFRDTALNVIRREALPAAAGVCRVLPSALGEELGDRAALGVAMNRTKGNQQ